MTPEQIDQYRTRIVDDAAFVGAQLAAAVAVLGDFAGGGYPGQTPGARPVGSPAPSADDVANGRVSWTSVERDALLKPADRAVHGLERLLLALADAASTLHRLRLRVARVAPYEPRPGEVSDPSGVCVWHGRFGFHEPIGSDPRTVELAGEQDSDGAPVVLRVCRWCSDYARAEGVLPATMLLELRAQGRKLVPHLVEAGRRQSTVSIVRPKKAGSRAKERREQRVRAERGSGTIDITAGAPS